jgi:hypothetical protein
MTPPCPWPTHYRKPGTGGRASDALHALAGSLAFTYDDHAADAKGLDREPTHPQDWHAGRVRDLAVIRAEMERAEREVIDDARAAGLSWQQIGVQLGMSRQAAQQRFGGKK